MKKFLSLYKDEHVCNFYEYDRLSIQVLRFFFGYRPLNSFNPIKSSEWTKGWFFGTFSIQITQDEVFISFLFAMIWTWL